MTDSLMPCQACGSENCHVRHFEYVSAEPGGIKSLIDTAVICFACNHQGRRSSLGDDTEESRITLAALKCDIWGVFSLTQNAIKAEPCGPCLRMAMTPPSMAPCLTTALHGLSSRTISRP